MTNQLKRRDFIKTSAGIVVLGALPNRARAISANGKLRTGHVGVGGMGVPILLRFQVIRQSKSRDCVMSTPRDWRVPADDIPTQKDSVISAR